MARDQKLNVDITASDKASAQITDVANKVDKLDGKAASVTVDADTKGFTEGVDGLDGRLDDVLGKVKDIGGRGAAGGVLAIGAGLLAAADHAADVAIEVGNLKALTGDTAEGASKLNGVWKQGGFDAKDLQDVLLQMNGVLAESPELAERLGINLADGKSTGDRFLEVTKKLGSEFTDAGERSQIASQLFGEEGVRQVNAVEQAFGDLSTAVDDYSGKVWSDEEIARMREYKAEVARVTTEFEQLAVKGGSTFLRLKGGIEDAGYSIGLFFRALATGEDTFDNWGDTKAFEAAEEQARLFDRTLLDHAKTIDEVRRIAQDYGLELHAVNLVTNEWASKNKTATETILEQANAIEGAYESTDAYAEVQDIAAMSAKRLADEAEKEAERLEDVRAEAADASQAIQALDTDYQNLKRELSDEKAFIDVQRSFETLGADAAAAIEAGTDATLDQQEALIDLKLKVGEYADEVLHLPDASITVIEALIDAGKIAEAEAQLAWLSRGRDIPLTPKVGGLGGSSFFAKGTQSAPPGLAVVGEEGPELVAFRGGEKVYTAGQTRSMMSGDGFPARRNVTISLKGANFYGTPSPQWIRDTMRQAERYERGLR